MCPDKGADVRDDVVKLYELCPVSVKDGLVLIRAEALIRTVSKLSRQHR